MSTIKRAPDRPPATSPVDPRYFDERDLEAELRRTFQICHECRMCVSYCGAFPELLSRVDRDIDGGKAEGAEALDHDDMRAVSEACWQCKLCYIKCPYTADDGARELLDFPRLMAREKAAHALRNGISLVDRLLGEPQVMGALSSGIAAPMSNLIQESRLLRKIQEKVTGISADFPMPTFARETFPRWFDAHQPSERAGEQGEVVLFATCYGNFNTPEVPKAAVEVLEHVGYRVHLVEETCCGMPNLDGGDVDGFVSKVRRNVEVLLPLVRAGSLVLVPSPTCGYTMKREWAEYLPEPEVREVAQATRDLMEFLEELRRDKALPPAERSLGKVAYHAACHLRAQKVGFPGMRLLSKLAPETEVRLVQECSAVDGTWGMKAKHYDSGRHYAHKLVAAMEDDELDWIVTDCGLSALRIAKETGQQVLHPIQALAEAYEL